MKKKELKEKIKDLPADLSIIGLSLLSNLAEAGVVGLSEILKRPSQSMGKNRQRAGQIKENSARTILWRLQKKGLVKKKERYYEITSLGLKTIKIFQQEQEGDKIEEIWDGKWRIIMFDIPERKREDRNWLRCQLLGCDYKPLQKSVFIGKQPLAEDFYEEILIRKIKEFIHLMTVGKIDEEKILDI